MLGYGSERLSAAYFFCDAQTLAFDNMVGCAWQEEGAPCDGGISSRFWAASILGPPHLYEKSPPKSHDTIADKSRISGIVIDVR